jgi:hypothetical protein
LYAGKWSTVRSIISFRTCVWHTFQESRGSSESIGFEGHSKARNRCLHGLEVHRQLIYRRPASDDSKRIASYAFFSSM